MAKAFLSKDTAERVKAARKDSIEKAAEKPVIANKAPTPPPAQTYTAPYSAPIPIPKAAKAVPSSSPAASPAPSPVHIQQVFVYPPVDNSALVKERAEKEKVQELYHAEKTARAASRERHQQELQHIKQAANEQLHAEQQARIKAEELQRQEAERIQQLTSDDDSLKRKYQIVLGQVSADEETIRRITAENEALKQELEKLRKINEEKAMAHETSEKDEDTKIESGVPLAPDYEEPHPAESIASIATNNDVQLIGDIAAESPVEDGSNDKCVVS